MSDRIFVIRHARLLAIIVLAGVFGYSGLHKLFNPEDFALSVFRFHLLPHSMVNVLSLWIAWLELVCALILLFLSRFRRAVLWLILCLLIIFSFGIGINLARGSYMACGCFSSSPMAHSVGWVGLLKNICLTGVTLYALRKEAGKRVRPIK